MAGRTIPKLFEDSVNKYASNNLTWEKIKGVYKAETYSRMKERVYSFAAGLINYGIKKGDRIALISEGRNDWVMCELGILYTGAVNVPVSIKIDELEDLKFRLAHSECRLVIVSESQVKKIRQVKKELLLLEKTILLDKPEKFEMDEIYKNDLMDSGLEYLKSHSKEFEKIWNEIDEKDYANICYTSGTTADPKGTILTHRNYTANTEQATYLLPIPQRYVSLLILPWDHSFAHTVGIYTLIKNGASIASVQNGRTPIETLKNIPVNIKEIRPTFLLSVPSLAKSFKKNIEKAVREKGQKTEKMFYSALKLAYRYNAEGWNRGKGMRIFLKPVYVLYDILIFSKIRKSFGGRLEFFIGGGALLDLELQHFFYAIGIPMFQGYGLTEAAPIISSNVPKKHKLGSSGYVVKGLEIKIYDDNGHNLPAGIKGEIAVKGENVMAGYWKNEKATGETVRNGWLFTGDVGYMDNDGFLYVLGRNKSLLISNDGEKYSPEGIEEAITDKSLFIEQIMLYNNQNTYTTALLVPNKDNLILWLSNNNLSCQSKEGSEAVLKLLESEINQYRDGGKYEGLFPQRWIPSAIGVLEEPFTEKNSFINSTLKIVRGKIIAHYKDRIEFLYTPEAKNICNTLNMNVIEKLCNYVKGE